MTRCLAFHVVTGCPVGDVYMCPHTHTRCLAFHKVFTKVFQKIQNGTDHSMKNTKEQHWVFTMLARPSFYPKHAPS